MSAIPDYVTEIRKREADTGVVRRGFAVTKAEDGRTVVVASTADVDRMDDIIDQVTWKLDNYAANPVILWMHDPYSHPPIGRGEAAIVEGALKAAITWDEGDELGAECKRKYDAKFLHAVSVGFRPGRSVARKGLDPSHPWFKADGWGYVYYDCDLLEISAVGIPANPKATTSKGLPVDPADFEAMSEALSEAIGELRATKALVVTLTTKVAEMSTTLGEVKAMVGLGTGDDGGDDDEPDTTEEEAIKAAVAALAGSSLLA
jgi:hypothetical protein